MRRALVLFLVSLAALIVAGPAAASAEPLPPQIKFELHADGFLVVVRSELDRQTQKLVLALDRRGEVAYYEVPAEIGEDTVKARFGQLGELDYTFMAAPQVGSCPKIGAGTFQGTFDFTGENEYAHFEVDNAHGTWIGSATNGCKERAARRSSTVSNRLAAVGAEQAHEEEEEATLDVHSGRKPPFRYLLAFEISVGKGKRAFISAFQAEKVEGMEVERGAQVAAPARDFTWDLAAGTAEVDPPAPFKGSATLTRRPGGRSVWSGSLTVPVLGAQPIRLAGPGFTAKLGAGSLLD